MALVWSINERASHGCPRISESQNNQNQLSLPPIILVSYKHTRLAQNTFERERGVLEKTKPERGLQPTLSIDGVAVSVTKSEGERG